MITKTLDPIERRQKRDVKIVTDSTSYIEQALARDLDITVVPLNINFKTKSYKETSLTNEEFYNIMENSTLAPMSSQPSPSDFYATFRDFVQAGQKILGIFISSDMSGTYSAAVTARNMILERHPRAQIELVDSRTSCMHMGYPVLCAARAALEGRCLEEVSNITRDVMGRSRIYFVPKTLEYLKRGGRIGSASTLLGTILQVKPILSAIAGKVAVVDKVRTMEKALNRMYQILEEHFEKSGIAELTVLHINSMEEAKKIARHIEAKFGIAPAVGAIGPVIGLHIGPGSLGMAYYLKK